MADTFVSAIIFRTAPKARNLKKQRNVISRLCEKCFAQEMRACARVTWRFRGGTVAVSLRDRLNFWECCRFLLPCFAAGCHASNFKIATAAMTPKRGVFVWKTDVFCFMRSFFARCRSASSFKRFVPEIVPFPRKTDQICHCEEGAVFAPDAAIFNEAIFILFLPHLGACLALLPCLSSVFSKK